VFEKTRATTPKTLKVMFLDIEKERKNVKKTYTGHLNHSAFNYSITGSQYQ